MLHRSTDIMRTRTTVIASIFTAGLLLNGRFSLFLTNKTNFMAKVSRNTGLDTGVGSRIPAAPGRRSGHRTKQFEGKSRLGGETCPHEFIILDEKKPAGRNSTIF